MKRTPLPWQMLLRSDGYRIIGADGNVVADDEQYYPCAPSETDAQDIVAAVNAAPTLAAQHARMRALLAKIVATKGGTPMLEAIDEARALIAELAGGA